MSTQPELSSRQLFEMALIEEDILAANGGDGHTAALGMLVKYARAEGITDQHLDGLSMDLASNFRYARMAVVIQQYQRDFLHECYGRKVLIAAGIVDPSEPPLPDPDDGPDEEANAAA